MAPERLTFRFGVRYCLRAPHDDGWCFERQLDTLQFAALLPTAASDRGAANQGAVAALP